MRSKRTWHDEYAVVFWSYFSISRIRGDRVMRSKQTWRVCVADAAGMMFVGVIRLSVIRRRRQLHVRRS